MRTAVLAFALAASALAQEPADRHGFEKDLTFSGPENAAPADARPATAWGAFASLAGTTLVILLLLGALLYCVKRFAPGLRGRGPSAAIQVLGSRVLTPGASLFLVQIGRRLVRVGVGKDGMTYLGEIADADEIAYVRGQCEGKAEEGFREALAAKQVEEPAVEAPAPAVKSELDSIRETVEAWKKASVA